jgi:hypothetical protein
MLAYILPSGLGEHEILLLHIYSAPFCLRPCLWLGYVTRVEQPGSMQLVPTKYLQLKFRPVI